MPAQTGELWATSGPQKYFVAGTILKLLKLLVCIIYLFIIIIFNMYYIFKNRNTEGRLVGVSWFQLGS